MIIPELNDRPPVATGDLPEQQKVLLFENSAFCIVTSEGANPQERNLTRKGGEEISAVLARCYAIILAAAEGEA